uniref:Uncharacterized protein n=1 Tax=Romanomermis culicivorax TaxID=13658 RepID=A0A915JWD1_ROMCU
MILSGAPKVLVELWLFNFYILSTTPRFFLADDLCISSQLIFSVGLIIVDCSTGGGSKKSIGQLVLDFMSDSILSFDSMVTGLPIVTKDAKYVVTIQKSLGRMFMQNITEKSLSKAKIIDEFLPLDEFTVLPGLNFENWILYATSKFSNNLIGVEIPSGKEESTKMSILWQELYTKTFSPSFFEQINRLFNVKSSSNYTGSPVVLESSNLDFLVLPEQSSGFTVYKWQSPFENSTWSSSSPTNLFLQENCRYRDDVRDRNFKTSESVHRKLMIKLDN